MNLEEQQKGLRRRLSALGFADPAEEAERQANLREAQRMREWGERSAADLNSMMAADAGLAPLEAVQERVRRGESQVVVGGIRMPASDDPQ